MAIIKKSSKESTRRSIEAREQAALEQAKRDQEIIKKIEKELAPFVETYDEETGIQTSIDGVAFEDLSIEEQDDIKKKIKMEKIRLRRSKRNVVIADIHKTGETSQERTERVKNEIKEKNDKKQIANEIKSKTYDNAVIEKGTVESNAIKLDEVKVTVNNITQKVMFIVNGPLMTGHIKNGKAVHEFEWRYAETPFPTFKQNGCSDLAELASYGRIFIIDAIKNNNLDIKVSSPERNINYNHLPTVNGIWCNILESGYIRGAIHGQYFYWKATSGLNNVALVNAPGFNGRTIGSMSADSIKERLALEGIYTWNDCLKFINGEALETKTVIEEPEVTIEEEVVTEKIAEVKKVAISRSYVMKLAHEIRRSSNIEGTYKEQMKVCLTRAWAIAKAEDINESIEVATTNEETVITVANNENVITNNIDANKDIVNSKDDDTKLRTKRTARLTTKEEIEADLEVAVE